MQEGKYLFAIADSVCMLKPVGDITYAISADLDTFLQEVFTDAGISGFIIDLTETEYIDSTNLGLLARIHEYSRTRLHSRPVIVSTKKQINEILNSLGFDRIFEMIQTPLQELKLSEIEHIDAQKENLGRIMLCAHQTLMQMNEQNRQCFRNVVDYLRRDISRGDG